MQLAEGRLFLVGRSRASDLVVRSDGYVSRRHFQVRVTADSVVLEDAGSSHGTLHNDRQVQEPVLLEDGDHIQAGKTVFRIELSEPASGDSEPTPQPDKGSAGPAADADSWDDPSDKPPTAEMESPVTAVPAASPPAIEQAQPTLDSWEAIWEEPAAGSAFSPTEPTETDRKAIPPELLDSWEEAAPDSAEQAKPEQAPDRPDEPADGPEPSGNSPEEDGPTGQERQSPQAPPSSGPDWWPDDD